MLILFGVLHQKMLAEAEHCEQNIFFFKNECLMEAEEEEAKEERGRRKRRRKKEKEVKKQKKKFLYFVLSRKHEGLLSLLSSETDVSFVSFAVRSWTKWRLCCNWNVVCLTLRITFYAGTWLAHVLLRVLCCEPIGRQPEGHHRRGPLSQAALSSPRAPRSPR